MNALVIGAHGFLGSYLLDELNAAGHTVVATARNVQGCVDRAQISWFPCDVTDSAQVDALIKRISGLEHIRIFYLAACHHPDMVQREPRLAWDTNITALSALLNKVEHVESLFYPSTDSVYGEGSLMQRFCESAPLAPVNRYGRQKALAEQLVLACGYHVVRFPFLIGPSLCEGKMHFYDTIQETVAAGRQMEMFSDSYRSALSFRQAARFLVRLSEKVVSEVPRILNVASDDVLSKYDIGCMIARRHGLKESLIVPISMERGEGIFEAPRAGTTLLDNTLLKQALGLSQIHLQWEEKRGESPS